MKKILLALLLSGTILLAGPIKNQLMFINKNQSVTIRIERKLDLIIQQYIKEEEALEQRDKDIEKATQKAIEGIEKSKTWIKKKTHEMLENELIYKMIKDKNSSRENVNEEL